jgi:hypothetical protein
VVVEFDGVYQNSEVWINGHYLGKRPFGYITFSYDLTSHLEPGNNTLAVRVDNSRQPNSRWYSGSGIYRHAWLIVTNPVHVAQWGTFVTTPRISEAAATVRVKTRIRNGSASPNFPSRGSNRTLLCSPLIGEVSELTSGTWFMSLLILRTRPYCARRGP